MFGSTLHFSGEQLCISLVNARFPELLGLIMAPGIWLCISCRALLLLRHSLSYSIM